METVFNRASARGMTLSQTLGDRAYFPGETFAAADRFAGAPGLDAKYGDLLGLVRNGSNISGYATGNASGTVGFAGGPQTFKAGGERFGIEGPDMKWAAEQQKLAQSTSTAATNLTQFQSTTSAATTNLGEFGGGLGQMASQLIGGLGKGGGGLLSSLFGLFGLKFADGAAFAHGSVIPFADGGVVGSPTTFRMPGGRTGLMGEAGPEAIMPLARGPGGRLGVRASGPMAGSRSMVVSNNSSISIGGSTVILQGGTEDAAEKVSAMLDQREAALEARLRREQRLRAVDDYRFASTMRG